MGRLDARSRDRHAPPVKRARILLAFALLAARPAVAQRNEAADRAAIHALLVAYGTTLDARDFDGFARLFGRDGVYATAANPAGAHGGEAADALRRGFAANPHHYGQPNFHLFFNEVVTFDGPDRAHATSMSLWMVPDENRHPFAALSARYEDDLVRRDGRWLFARRTVKPIVNGPAR